MYEKNLVTVAYSMSDAALKASIFQRLHPRAYLERFIAENFRPDGRPFDAWRDVSVNVGRFVFMLSSFHVM